MSKEHHDFLGTIPHGWEAKKLKELVEFKNGKAHEQCVDENGEYILVTSKFVSTEGDEYRRTNQALSMLNKNDIAFVMSDVPNGKALAKCFLVDVDNKYTLNQRICSLTTLSMNHQFLFYFLNRNKYYLKFDNGVGQTNLRKDEVLDCPVFVPPLKEQQKIAEILSSVDAAIEKTEQVIAKTEEVKKGLMQQLLTKGIGHTEFKQTEIGEIPLTWDLVKLEEVTQLITKGTTPTTYGYKFEDNGVNFIKVENLRQSINSNELLKISYECHEKLQRSQLQIGDILFSIAGTLGSTYIVDESILPCNTNQALSIIRLKNNVNICYINYVLNSNLIQKEIDGLRTVGAQPNLNLKQVGNFTIPFPPIEEQDRISQIIKKNEEMVYNEIKKLRKLKSLKQGLMQQLLTGQVRVKID